MQKKMPEISVVVPCYNVETVLPRCIESLISQTISIQIILVNDGSTDHTLDVIEKYQKANPQIKVINKSNAGLPQARKSGLALVESPYVCFLDSDDWVEPTMYEDLLSAALRTGSDIATCGFYKSYEDGTQVYEQQKYDSGTILSKDEAFHALHLRKDVFPYMWNKVFKKSLFENVSFPEKNFVGEDYVTFIQVLGKVDQIVIVSKPLHHYWQSNASMSRGGFKESHRIGLEQYKTNTESLLTRHPQYSKDVFCYLSVEYMAVLIAMSRNSKYEKPIIKEITSFLRQHLPALVFSEMALPYKGCAILASINHRLLVFFYKFLGEKRRK